MKSIKTYLFPLILLVFFNTQLYSQDDFYTEKKQEIKIEPNTSKTDSILIFGYFTEQDFNELYGIEMESYSSDSEFYYDDEEMDKERQRKMARDSFFGEVAAEVVVEVVVNAIFILAAFWQ